MRDLKELALLLKQIKLKPSDILIVNQDKKNNSNIFLNKILDDSFKSDNEAASFFFNTDPSHSKYKNLKHSLKEKILNTLFFINPQKHYSDYQKTFIFCCKNIFIAKILIHLTIRKIGVNLSYKVFTKATSYEMTEFIIHSSKILRMQYATRIGDEKKFHYYNDIFKENIKIWQVECLAEEYYNILVLPYVKSKSKKTDTASKAEAYYKELAPYLLKYKSPYLHYVTTLIRVVEFMSKNEYEKVIQICDEAILFFENKPYSYKSPIRSFLQNQLVCCIQLKKYEKGKKIVLKTNKFIRVGTHNWLQNEELHFILALHSKEYQEAFYILKEVNKNRNFKDLGSLVKEKWLIYEKYIEFLIRINKIENVPGLLKPYQIGKFLNSLPIFSKDKRGLNIPILIIQILFMIISKDYDKALDRFEAINKYCTRYLIKDDNFRSNCFIKMLLQIPISNFHKSAVQRRAKKYLERLTQTPINISNQTHEIEIIPYEELWEIILEFLDFKIYKLKRVG